MSQDFYRAYEDRYRGSRELIKSRLSVYLPFVQPLLGWDSDAKAVDLGCGRGEWLELIDKLGFDALGVDLDQGMLSACHELGLKVVKEDALGFISSLPAQSHSVVSAFHVVEHITFEQLQTLVSQAFRVLKPGGLLIMETPNPENIVVATNTFYNDPTHQRPIPPELLSFLPQHYHFARTKVLRLQESKALTQRTNLTLYDVLDGASPDYAVVAQKAAIGSVMSQLDMPFLLEYGLSLENLSIRYQNQIFERLTQVEAQARQAEVQARQAEAQARQAEVQARQAEAQAQQAEAKAQQAEAKAQQAEAQAQQAEAQAQQAEAASNDRFTQLQAVYASTSWRLTKPLRAFKRILSGDFSIFGRLTAAGALKVKVLARRAVASTISQVLKRPKVRNALNPALNSCPWLRQRLLRVMHNTNAVREEPSATFTSFGPAYPGTAHLLQTMTPHACQLYAALRAAVDKKKTGE